MVQATDQATLPANRLSVRKTILISILDVNDNSPVFISPPTGAVPENSRTSTEVMTVKAKDKDTGLNARVSYQDIGFFTM